VAGWRAALETFLVGEWAGGGVAQCLLRPLSWLYAGVLWQRRMATGSVRPADTSGTRLRAPLVVVGNLTVGGSGKTPCVMALAQALAARGWHPGIVSRGYAGRGLVEPVLPESRSAEVGDEPLLMARSTGLPVWVGRDRLAAARALLAAHAEVDVLLSDDGLQHQPLPRDVEVVVVDARRGFGNRRLLPAGPLREPLARLATVDQLWVCGDGPMPRSLPSGLATASPVRITLELAADARSLAHPGEVRPLSSFAGAHVVALAGIAAPQRFFDMLAAAGIAATPEPWSDHQAFAAGDLQHLRDRTVLMTGKDAVKCESFAAAGWWVVSLEVAIPAGAVDAIEQRLRRAARGAAAVPPPRRT